MWKATGSYHTYSIPGKTAVMVPKFAGEDLPSAELQPRFLPLLQNTLLMMMVMIMMMMIMMMMMKKKKCTYGTYLRIRKMLHIFCINLENSQ